MKTVFIVTDSNGDGVVVEESLRSALSVVKGINRRQSIFTVTLNLDSPQYLADVDQKGELSVYQLIPNPE